MKGFNYNNVTFISFNIILIELSINNYSKDYCNKYRKNPKKSNGRTHNGEMWLLFEKFPWYTNIESMFQSRC